MPALEFIHESEGLKHLTVKAPIMRRLHVRATSISILLLMLICTPFIGIISANEPPDGGQSITITGDVTWDQDDDFDGIVDIANGASLTISADLDVANESRITVHPGGTLSISNGSLNAEWTDTDYSWMRNSDEGHRSRIMIETAERQGSFDVILTSAKNSYFNGMNAVVDGTATAMEGDNHTISFSAGSSDTWIEFTGASVYEMILSSEIRIDYPGIKPTETIPIGDIPHENWMVNDPGTFDIDVQGTMNTNGAFVYGAVINVAGTLNFSTTDIVRSTPIIATDAASIRMNTVDLKDSRDDHHITAGIQTIIDLSESTIHGTLVDFWERQLEQTIQFRANEVIVTITDFGHPPSTTNPIPTNEQGLMTLPLRTVEIGFADGTVWNEDATIVIQSYKTAWNAQLDDYGSSAALPIESTTIYESEILPMLTIDSIIPEETSVATDGRVKMNATITNSGSGDARIGLECFIGNGSAADVGGYPVLEIPGDSTQSVEFTWRGVSETGNQSITCGVIQPAQLAIEGAYGGLPVVSESVTWTEPVADTEGLGMLPLITALLVGAVLIGIAALQYSANIQKEKDEQRKTAAETGTHSQETEKDRSEVSDID